MSGGGRRSRRRVALGLIAIALLLHGFAYLVLYRHADLSGPPDMQMLVVLTGSLALYGSLMLSQAMEAVTRAFYGRADLDLILSSPVVAWRLFAVRIGAIAMFAVAIARAHSRAVPCNRSQAHAALRADRCRRGRRELRDWRAIRCNPFLRRPVPSRLSTIGSGDQICPGERKHPVVAGARHPRRCACANGRV